VHSGANFDANSSTDAFSKCTTKSISDIIPECTANVASEFATNTAANVTSDNSALVGANRTTDAIAYCAADATADATADANSSVCVFIGNCASVYHSIVQYVRASGWISVSSRLAVLVDELSNTQHNRCEYYNVVGNWKRRFIGLFVRITSGTCHWRNYGHSQWERLHYCVWYRWLDRRTKRQ
jgi:hypothetical protein